MFSGLSGIISWIAQIFFGAEDEKDEGQKVCVCVCVGGVLLYEA